MRWLAGWLLLLLLFGAAALWQSRLLAGYRSTRDPDSDLPGVQSTNPSTQAGWSRLIVGAPSGAEPIEPLPMKTLETAETAGLPVETANVHGEAQWIEERSGALEDFVIEVQAGQTLSEIAQAHYHDHSAEMVQALARYNDLANPNQIRVGQRIYLPEIQRLLPDSSTKPDR